MMSLDNAYSADELAEFHRRIRRRAARRRGAELLRRAQARRGEHRGRLRGRPPRAGEHTRRRRDGRGHHEQRPAPPLACRTGSRYDGKLTLRGEVVIYRRDFEALNAEREAEGLRALRQPAQRRRRGRCGCSIRARCASRPLRALFYQLVEGPKVAPTQSAALEWLEKQTLPTHRRHKVVRLGRGLGGDRAHRPVARGLPLRDRRRGHQGRLVPAPGHAGDDVEVPEVGDGLQVRRRARADQAARHRGAGRAHGDAHARRRRSTPWSWRAPPSSRASLHNAGMVETLDVRDRRPRLHPEGRRGDPAGRRRRPVDAHGPREEVPHARQVPLCGTPRRAAS